MRGAGYAVLKDPDKLTAGQSEAFNNRIKVTVRMAYGFHRVTNLIALVMPRCGGLDIRLPQPTIQPTKTSEASEKITVIHGGRWKGAVMSERTCNIAGCHNPAESNGLCARHFTRALVYGQLRVANHAASLSGAVPRGGGLSTRIAVARAIVRRVVHRDSCPLC